MCANVRFANEVFNWTQNGLFCRLRRNMGDAMGNVVCQLGRGENVFKRFKFARENTSVKITMAWRGLAFFSVPSIHDSRSPVLVQTRYLCAQKGRPNWTAPNYILSPKNFLLLFPILFLICTFSCKRQTQSPQGRASPPTAQAPALQRMKRTARRPDS